MEEKSKLEYTLAVTATNNDGTVKEARYIKHKNGSSVEFIPNKLYLYLLNKGFIKPETFKIPFLLGKNKWE